MPREAELWASSLLTTKGPYNNADCRKHLLSCLKTFYFRELRVIGVRNSRRSVNLVLVLIDKMEFHLSHLLFWLGVLVASATIYVRT